MGTTMLSNEFELLEEIRNDDVFRWSRARCTSTGETVILQILTTERAEKIYSVLQRYFEQLQAISKSYPGVLAPWKIFSDRPAYPLVMVYADVAVTPLDALLRQPASAMMAFWKEAANLVHALHIKNMLHGNLSMAAFGQLGNQVVLQEFGYAPLMLEKDQSALQACKFKAPEVLTSQALSPASDTFAFAKTMIACHKELRSLPWNDQATNVRPEKRYQKIRELIRELEEYQEKQRGGSASTKPPEPMEVDESTLPGASARQPAPEPPPPPLQDDPAATMPADDIPAPSILDKESTVLLPEPTPAAPPEVEEDIEIEGALKPKPGGAFEIPLEPHPTEPEPEPEPQPRPKATPKHAPYPLPLEPQKGILTSWQIVLIVLGSMTLVIFLVVCLIRVMSAQFLHLH